MSTMAATTAIKPRMAIPMPRRTGCLWAGLADEGSPAPSAPATPDAVDCACDSARRARMLAAMSSGFSSEATASSSAIPSSMRSSICSR